MQVYFFNYTIGSTFTEVHFFGILGAAINAQKGALCSEKTWLNCGLDVLCVMLYYDGEDLARIVEKVLSK